MKLETYISIGNIIYSAVFGAFVYFHNSSKAEAQTLRAQVIQNTQDIAVGKQEATDNSTHIEKQLDYLIGRVDELNNKLDKR